MIKSVNFQNIKQQDTTYNTLETMTYDEIEEMTYNQLETGYSSVPHVRER